MIAISVLIVNYNTASLVKKCIGSILQQTGIRFEVIVVDNHSEDQSLAVLQDYVPRVTLIANKVNVGFGKANNQAFQVCKGNYVFMLNPDAQCLTELDLLHAVQYMETHPEVGLAGTRIVGPENTLENTVFFAYPREQQTRADFSALPGKWATVLGASMICRAEVYEKIGGFDEDFFLYGEETDLCLRIRQRGFQIGYCETVTVAHVGGASEKNHLLSEIIRKKKAGKLLFYCKHYPKEDVLKIVKKDRNHALFHVLRLKLLDYIFGLNHSQKSRLERHQVSLDLAKAFLGLQKGAKNDSILTEPVKQLLFHS